MSFYYFFVFALLAVAPAAVFARRLANQPGTLPGARRVALDDLGRVAQLRDAALLQPQRPRAPPSRMRDRG